MGGREGEREKEGQRERERERAERETWNGAINRTSWANTTRLGQTTTNNCLGSAFVAPGTPTCLLALSGE
eukprot:11194081-Lingulodinium_polyedra.AAC.1